MSDFVPMDNSMTRVYIIEGRARPDHVPDFMACMRADALSQGFGDVTDIMCPDETSPGKYVKIGEFQTGEERATITLEGRMAVALRSKLMRLAKQKCPFDVQLHAGNCEDLSNFSEFKKSIFLESGRAATYDTDPLGSLQDDDRAEVNESIELSARVVYDTVAMGFNEEAGDIVTNEVLDVVACDSISCGDCTDESSGCQKWYAVTSAAGGSPGTPPDVVYSIDGGDTWFAHDIDVLGATDDADANACVGAYHVVVSNAAGGIAYVLLTELDGITDPAYTLTTAGVVAGGEPNDIWSVGNKAYVVGDWGYIYDTIDPTGGLTVRDAGDLTVSNLLTVHGLSSSYALAAGNDGVILVSIDGTNWALATTTPIGIGTNINVIKAKSKTEWWIGTSAGEIWYTLNSGTTWTLRAFPGSGAGIVHDLEFATDSILYVSHSTAAPLGRVLASFSGGSAGSFQVLPQDTTLMPANDRFTAIAACLADPGKLVSVGLADNAADGIIVVGSMPEM